MRLMTTRQEYSRAAIYGAAAVAIAAGVQNFWHLTHLAMIVGDPPVMAVALPLSTEGAIVAAAAVRVWDERRGRRSPWWVVAVELAGIAGSLVGNAMSASGRGPWGALLAMWPVLMFAGSVEVLTYIARTAPETAVSEPVVGDAPPAVAEDPEPGPVAPASREAPPEMPREDAVEDAVEDGLLRRPRAVEVPPSPVSDDDAGMVAALVAGGRVPSIAAVRARFGVGSGRATRIRDAAAAELEGAARTA